MQLTEPDNQKRIVDVGTRPTINRRRVFHLLGGTMLASATPLSYWQDYFSATDMAQTALLLDLSYKRHETGPQHPERPERMDAIFSRVEEMEFSTPLDRITPRLATSEELAACHDEMYIALVKREVMAGARILSTGDTAISSSSFDVAILAAGGVMVSVDAVVESKVKNAFCAVRPPGHHASRAQGMGFCIFNNIALAARYAQRRHKIRKVAIIDWDVHHGNGTQNIFYEDPSVFFFSTHQSPWYPYTGLSNETGYGQGLGSTMNIPLPAGSGRSQIFGAMQDRLLPALHKFRPELIFISAGFDSKLGDPLGRFELIDKDFVDMTRFVMSIAKEHCQNRIVSILEGGYHLDGMSSAVAAHVGALAGEL